MNAETVEEALDFTMLEIRTGARPWYVRNAAIDKLRQELEPSYTKNHGEWPTVRNKVLRLARYHGALAALIHEIVEGPRTGPRYVEYWSLQLAGLFTQLACPRDAGGIEMFGKHCQSIHVAALDATSVKKLFEIFVRAAELSEWKELLDRADQSGPPSA